MKIIYHLGAHCTDDERLLRCLLKNRDTLTARGVIVPGPAKYRSLLRDTAITLNGQAASEDTQFMVLDQIMEEDKADRLILSWENFLSFPAWAIKDGLYTAAAERIRAFAQIFPSIEAEFFLAIRNPATFLPELFSKQKDMTAEEFLSQSDVLTLRWADMIEDIHRMNPNVPLTIWCNEDTPLLWPDVLEAVSGITDGTSLEGSDELLTTLMSAEGYGRMRTYLDSHPPANRQQWRRVISAFLDKFAIPEAVEMEIEFPGWTEATLAQLTANYMDDIAEIKKIPGVRVLMP